MTKAILFPVIALLVLPLGANVVGAAGATVPDSKNGTAVLSDPSGDVPRYPGMDVVSLRVGETNTSVHFILDLAGDEVPEVGVNRWTVGFATEGYSRYMRAEAEAPDGDTQCVKARCLIDLQNGFVRFDIRFNETFIPDRAGICLFCDNPYFFQGENLTRFWVSTHVDPKDPAPDRLRWSEVGCMDHAPGEEPTDCHRTERPTNGTHRLANYTPYWTQFKCHGDCGYIPAPGVWLAIATLAIIAALRGSSCRNHNLKNEAL